MAPLNSYLRWLPCCYNPGRDRRRWYTQLMFAQHAANLSPVGRAQGTGILGITMFNRGGGPITFDPLEQPGSAMNAHLFLFGPTGSGKSATLNNLLEPGHGHLPDRGCSSWKPATASGPFSDFACACLGLTGEPVAGPGSGISLALVRRRRRLIETPSDVQTLDADALDEDPPPDAPSYGGGRAARRASANWKITARLDDHGRRGRSADLSRPTAR